MTDSSSSLQTRLAALFESALKQVAPGQDVPVVLERPKQADHGEFACTLAMPLARLLKRPPRDVAQNLVASLPQSDWVERVEIAGPGFINIFLTATARQSVVHEVLEAGNRWGCVNVGRNRKVQVEFVSSNPTGPLHVGHGRGAAFGASLSSLLDKAGYQVHREYYVNDAGRQMDILAVSTWLRYLEQAGDGIPFPPNGYQGDYVSQMASQLRDRLGDRLVRSAADVLAHTPGLPEEGSDDEARVEHHMDALIANAKALLGEDYKALHAMVLHEQLTDCRQDLEEFGVIFDEWFSEQALFDDGSVEKVIHRLEAAGHLYVQDGARWFRSSSFGDEKDRVVQRENGLYTYFASDIAYHVNKFERGFDQVVNVWGADHHGYIPRVMAALKALGFPTGNLKVPLVQFVTLYRHGEKVQMSTRKGQFITLRELRSETGRDAARFFYVLRKSDQHLDFDLDLAKSQSNDNPVYYVQYAHARIHSVLTKWGGDPASLDKVSLAPLVSAQEYGLMQALRGYPEVIALAAADFAPHMVAFHLRELAALLHSYYNAEQFLVEDTALREARLALIAAVGLVLRDGLTLLGVSAPFSM